VKQYSIHTLLRYVKLYDARITLRQGAQVLKLRSRVLVQMTPRLVCLTLGDTQTSV